MLANQCVIIFKTIFTQLTLLLIAGVFLDPISVMAAAAPIPAKAQAKAPAPPRKEHPAVPPDLTKREQHGRRSGADDFADAPGGE